MLNSGPGPNVDAIQIAAEGYVPVMRFMSSTVRSAGCGQVAVIHRSPGQCLLSGGPRQASR
ncbi:MAG: hypothetical protein CM15mP103_07810 [Gammaproteobacteria bacterium]|nr:MAG: hypothetical protein CM15mP103_07810 [Gammaproteobacteria bacterium]